MGMISACTGFISWWHWPFLKGPAAWEITSQVVSLVCLFMQAFDFDFESSEHSCWHFEEDVALGVSSNINNEYLERLTCTDPKCLHILYMYILSEFNNTHNSNTHAHTQSHISGQWDRRFFFKQRRMYAAGTGLLAATHAGRCAADVRGRKCPQ